MDDRALANVRRLREQTEADLRALGERRRAALDDLRRQREELRALVLAGQELGLSRRHMARLAGVSHEHLRQLLSE